MTKNVVPVGSDRTVVRREANPFSLLQQEIDRLFEGFGRSFPAFGPAATTLPSMDVSESDKQVGPHAIWGSEILERLNAVKATWDAGNVFRSNHELRRTQSHAPSGSLRRAPRPIIAPSRIAPQQP